MKPIRETMLADLPADFNMPEERKHHYIVAGTYRDASLVVRSLHLPMRDWTWADDGGRIRALDPKTSVVIAYETWQARRNVREIAHALDHAADRGVEVRHMNGRML